MIVIEKVENANKILNENSNEFLSELEIIKKGVNICLEYLDMGDVDSASLNRELEMRQVRFKNQVYRYLGVKSIAIDDVDLIIESFETMKGTLLDGKYGITDNHFSQFDINVGCDIYEVLLSIFACTSRYVKTPLDRIARRMALMTSLLCEFGGGR